jgi:hypothetical protein
MTEDEIITAKVILKDYQGYNGTNMVGIETIGIPSYRKYLRDMKGLKEKEVENTIMLLLDYLKQKDE